MDTGRPNQNCDMFRIERMTVASAIFSPQMVIMKLHSPGVIARRLRQKCLPVNRSVLRLDLRGHLAGFELGRNSRAIVTRNHEGRHELEQELLLQCVTETVVICIGVGLSSFGRCLREKQQTAKDPSQKHFKAKLPGTCPRWPHAFSLYAGRFVPSSRERTFSP